MVVWTLHARAVRSPRGSTMVTVCTFLEECGRGCSRHDDDHTTVVRMGDGCTRAGAGAGFVETRHVAPSSFDTPHLAPLALSMRYIAPHAVACATRSPHGASCSSAPLWSQACLTRAVAR